MKRIPSYQHALKHDEIKFPLTVVELEPQAVQNIILELLCGEDPQAIDTLSEIIRSGDFDCGQLVLYTRVNANLLEFTRYIENIRSTQNSTGLKNIDYFLQDASFSSLRERPMHTFIPANVVTTLNLILHLTTAIPADDATQIRLLQTLLGTAKNEAERLALSPEEQENIKINDITLRRALYILIGITPREDKLLYRHRHNGLALLLELGVNAALPLALLDLDKGDTTICAHLCLLKETLLPVQFALVCEQGDMALTLLQTVDAIDTTEWGSYPIQTVLELFANSPTLRKQLITEFATRHPATTRLMSDDGTTPLIAAVKKGAIDEWPHFDRCGR